MYNLHLSAIIILVLRTFFFNSHCFFLKNNRGTGSILFLVFWVDIVWKKEEFLNGRAIFFPFCWRFLFRGFEPKNIFFSRVRSFLVVLFLLYIYISLVHCWWELRCLRFSYCAARLTCSSWHAGFYNSCAAPSQAPCEISLQSSSFVCC